MLLILLIRGLSLPGALQGVLYYLLPDPSGKGFLTYCYSVKSMDESRLLGYNTYNNNCYSVSRSLSVDHKNIISHKEAERLCDIIKDNDRSARQPLTFNRWYVYPAWAYACGWVLTFSSILLVPGWALYKLAIGTGSLSQRFHHLCQPASDCSLTHGRETELQHIGEEVQHCLSSS